MNQTLRSLTDKKLHESLKTVKEKERHYTLQVLEHLQEVHRRRLDARYGYSSLWAYLTEELGYEGGAAHRRIKAARLAQEVPEAKAALQKGELSLTSAATIQNFTEKEKRIKKRIYSTQEKARLIQNAKHQSTRALERKLAKISPESAAKEKQRPISETHTETTFILDEEDLQNLERLKELLSAKDPGITQSQILKHALKAAVENHEKRRFGAGKHPPRQSPKARTPGRPLQRQNFEKAKQQCTYISPLTNKKCQTRIGLQNEHRRPYAKGGPTSARNLTVLCRAHNDLRRREAFGQARPGG